MSDLNDLLKAIITHPDEDVPRLAYADALDELAPVYVTCPQCKGEKIVTTRWRIAEMDADDYGTSTGACSKCGAKGQVLDTANRDRAAKIREAVALAAAGKSWPETIGPTPEGMMPHINEGLPAHLMGVYYRGFFQSLECDAEVFLRNADALIWHPDQTVKCGCKGNGWWHQSVDNDPTDVGGPIDCMACGMTGHIPRTECPPTAQPIREVTLTTWPAGYQIDGLPPRDAWAAFVGSDLEKRYPGVKFHLPPA